MNVIMNTSIIVIKVPWFKDLFTDFCLDVVKPFELQINSIHSVISIQITSNWYVL